MILIYCEVVENKLPQIIFLTEHRTLNKTCMIYHERLQNLLQYYNFSNKSGIYLVNNQYLEKLGESKGKFNLK